jgi:hypothetical protein
VPRRSRRYRPGVAVEAVWRLGPGTVRRGWEAHARPAPSGKVEQASLGEMRLIISDDPSGDTWGYLEPGTSEEIESLEQSVAQGEWTIGRGAESILKLRALAGRLGYRIAEVHESSTVAPPRQVIVVRGATTLAALLRALVPPGVPVMSDRRVQERRTSTRSTANDRRQQDPHRPRGAPCGSASSWRGEIAEPRPRPDAHRAAPESATRGDRAHRGRVHSAPDTRSQSCCRSLTPKPGRAPGDEGFPPVPPRIRAWHVVRIFPAGCGWPSA